MSGEDGADWESRHGMAGWSEGEGRIACSGEGTAKRLRRRRG